LEITHKQNGKKRAFNLGTFLKELRKHNDWVLWESSSGLSVLSRGGLFFTNEDIETSIIRKITSPTRIFT